MPVCVSCNIEYEEDKKFCNYCGGPLSQKSEPISTPKKTDRADEEKSDGKLVCPRCKITYEFGSSCIQCGSPLGRQTSPQAIGEPQTTLGNGSEGKLPPVETSQEQQVQAPLKKLICPTCKIIYEQGEVCIKCESALVPQAPTQPNGEAKTPNESQVEEESLHVQTLQEQMVETPRKKLICPACKIIYERGDSCVRCGAALVLQTPSQEKEKPKSADIEFNPSISEPDGLEATFGPSFRPEAKPKPSGGGPGAAPELSSVPSPKAQDPGTVERGKKRELRVTSPLEFDFDEDYPQARASDQPVARKSADESDRRGSFPKKPKKDYRRLLLEAGGIMIMVVAVFWSVYSLLPKKQPEPGAQASKEAARQILPGSSSLANSVTPVTGPGESRRTEERSSISKEAIPVTNSLPDGSKTPSTETQEMAHIKTLLENVRQSNLQKDIDLFISCYASDFADLEARKRATLAYWEKFNYLDLSYDVKTPSISAETARAKIEWLIKTSSRGGGQPQENKSILDVTFKKEGGAWKIREVKPVK
jgi:rRNA maturation endonuclease Nob1